VPLVKNNWKLRSSIRARKQVWAALRTTKLDGLFFHTSDTTILSQRLMANIATVVSVDAAPLNFDSISLSYDHGPSSISSLESLKNSINQCIFRQARRLIIWNVWGKDLHVNQYGVDANKIVVIPPSVDLENWKPMHGAESQRKVRLFFVGGDFPRKGGERFLRTFRNSLARECELNMSTAARHAIVQKFNAFKNHTQVLTAGKQCVDAG
jgi:glycosyltransferase involved in cell wall biosynthesis